MFRGECGPEGDPESFREQFMATVEGLRPMTPEDLKLANNRRIEVIVAEPLEVRLDRRIDPGPRDATTVKGGCPG